MGQDRRLLLTVSLAALLGACQSTPPASAPDPFLAISADAAARAEAQGNHATAAGYYLQLSEQTPDDPGYALGAARNLRKAGSAQQALSLLERVLAARPDDPEVLRESGLAALELGRLDQAEILLSQGRAVAPRDWRMATALGVVLERKDRFGEALAAFEDAARLAPPGTAGAVNNLAMAYALRGRLDEAIGLLRSLGADAPEQARRNLALLEQYQREGRALTKLDVARAEVAAELEAHAAPEAPVQAAVEPPAQAGIEAPTPPPAQPGPGHYVQLASLQDEAGARSEIRRLRGRYGDLLGDIQLHSARTELGRRGTFYRVYGGPVAAERAAAICGALAERGVGCLVVEL